MHQVFRAVRTFCKWLIAMRVLSENPLTGIVMRKPQVLPQVPTDDEIRAVVKACPDTLTGRRNRALILTMVDTGVRSAECRNLLIESVDRSGPSILVRQGKGLKDRVLSLNPVTVRALKRWIEAHPAAFPQNHVFVYEDGRPMNDRGLLQILHRLSKNAKLPRPRYLHRMHSGMPPACRGSRPGCRSMSAVASWGTRP
jgi:integrase/recombinase XerC/integrase/recombinase XerD